MTDGHTTRSEVDSRLQRKSQPHWVKSLSMSIPAVLIGLQLSGWISFYFLPEMQSRSDFSAYYRAGYLLRTGAVHQLYQKQVFKEFIHPIYEAFVFVPFSLFSMQTAYVLWIATCVAFVLGIYLVIRSQLIGLRTLFPWLPMAVMLSYLPISYTAMQGQDSLLLALLVALAVRSMSQEYSGKAGLWLGLCMFRFQFLLPIVLLMVFWRRWRLLAGVLVTGTIAFCVSLAVGGWRLQAAYVKLLQAVADPASQPVFRMMNVRGLLTAIGLATPPIVVVASAAILIVIAYLGRDASNRDRLLLAISAGSLASYHFFLHDLSVMIIPILICMESAIESQRYLVLLVPAILTASPVVVVLVWGSNTLWALSLPTLVLIAVLVEMTKQSPSARQYTRQSVPATA